MHRHLKSLAADAQRRLNNGAFLDLGVKLPCLPVERLVDAQQFEGLAPHAANHGGEDCQPHQDQDGKAGGQTGITRRLQCRQPVFVFGGPGDDECFDAVQELGIESLAAKFGHHRMIVRQLVGGDVDDRADRRDVFAGAAVELVGRLIHDELHAGRRLGEPGLRVTVQQPFVRRRELIERIAQHLVLRAQLQGAVDQVNHPEVEATPTISLLSTGVGDQGLALQQPSLRGQHIRFHARQQRERDECRNAASANHSHGGQISLGDGRPVRRRNPVVAGVGHFSLKLASRGANDPKCSSLRGHLRL